MIKNKKAWIKIAEAFIALTLIAIMMLTVYSGQKNKPSNDNIIKLEDALLNSIVQNENFRQAIIKNDFLGDEITEDTVIYFLKTNLPSYLNFTVMICKVDKICAMSEYKTGVYAREKIVSSTWTDYSPKKLKLFVWEK